MKLDPMPRCIPMKRTAPTRIEAVSDVDEWWDMTFEKDETEQRWEVWLMDDRSKWDMMDETFPTKTEAEKAAKYQLVFGDAESYCVFEAI